MEWSILATIGAVGIMFLLTTIKNIRVYNSMTQDGLG